MSHVSRNSSYGSMSKILSVTLYVCDVLSVTLCLGSYACVVMSVVLCL